MRRKHFFPGTFIVSIVATILVGSFGHSLALNKDGKASFFDVPKESQDIQSSALHEKFFLPNQGQVFDTKGIPANNVLYMLEDEGVKMYFQKDRVSYVYQRFLDKDSGDNQAMKKNTNDLQKKEVPETIEQYRFDMVFQASNKNVKVECAEYGDEIYNFYYPNVQVENLRMCKRIKYINMYAFTDLEYYRDSRGNVKYDFVVHPSGDPKKISWRYEGVSSVEATRKGLIVNTPLGSMTENSPVSYQKIRTAKKDVASSYVLDVKKKTVNVKLGKYDPSKDLVIDPVLEWATYYGGSEWEWSTGIDSDGNGSVMSGHSTSTNLPVTNGTTIQSPLNVDAFIAKFDSSGNFLVGTYIGGDSEDRALDLVLDNNKIFITGFTVSSNFPITLGGINGSMDMFISHLNGSGNLVWSKRFGGSNGGTSGDSIAKLANGDLIVIGGSTASNLLTVPANNLSFNMGTQDGFVMRVDQNASVIWDTFLGGMGDDYLNAVDSDSQGNIVVIGDTTSTDLDLALGAISVLQNVYGGYLSDAYLVRLDTNGVLQWWSYMGGWSYDYGYGVAVDPDDNIIVDGLTWSSNFPISLNAFQPVYGGFGDAWVAKLTPNGGVVWNTYIGGSNSDVFYNVIIDHSSDIVLSGTTSSFNYPGTTNTFYSGGQDVSLTKITPNGQLLSSQYFGGASGDFGFDITENGTSLSMSGLGPIGIPNPVTPFAGGPNDALLIKWDNCTALPVDPIGPDGTVNRAYVENSGNNLYIGGYFKNVAGILVNGIAKWDGNTWSALGNGFPVNDVAVQDITEYNGELYATGYFNVNANLRHIAKWDSGLQVWQPLGSGLDGPGYALEVYNGELYVAGEFTDASGVPVKSIAKWNGVSWSAVDLGLTENSGDEKLYAMKEYNGELYVAGDFDMAGSSFIPAPNIAKWNGLNWSTVGLGVDRSVEALEVYNGELVLGGHFLMSGNMNLNYIGKWDGVSILPFYAQGADQSVSSLYVNSGILYVGGAFDQIDGVDVARSAQWNGVAWKHMSLDILNGPILDFAKFQNKEYFFGEYQSTCQGNPMFMTEYNP